MLQAPDTRSWLLLAIAAATAGLWLLCAAAALAAVRSTARARHEAGTLGHLIQRWEASPEYLGLSKMTKGNRDRYLKAFASPEFSTRQVASLTRAELLDVRNIVAANSGPAAANMFVQSASSLLSWAVDRGEIPYNVLMRAKALPGGHFPAWSEEEARIAIEKFPEAQRRAVILAYHTGLRRGDLITVGWSAFDGEAIWIQPQKTRKAREAKQLAPLRLACGPALRAELERWKAENSTRAKPATTILTSPTGLPWGKEGISFAIKKEVDRLKLREGLNLHGFRKLAATRLAEAGASANEIAAALGWESLSHVQLYTRAADQKRLAEAAVLRLEKKLSKGGK